MSAPKVMVVDDSPFSRTIIAETLQECSCEVVGEAASVDLLVETYLNCKPDIVTMDIAMPGSDGFECSKILLMHDPSAKIILVSSIKDEESEAEARRIGIAGYVQKPVESETLTRIITNVMAPDTLYANLELWSIDIFKEALAQSLTRLTKKNPTFNDKEWPAKNFSRGIAVVIGIIGRYPGTFILDISPEAAEKMTSKILHRVPNNSEVLAMAAELANVVGGIACSMLNKKDKNLSLRVAPPSVFYGALTEIASPSIQLRGVSAESEFGKTDICIGFKKGLVLWM